MKLRYEHIKNTCAIGAMLIFLIALHTATVYIFAVHKISTRIDPLASPEGITALTAYINNPEHRQKTKYQLAQTMHNMYPFIRSVTIAQTPDQSMHVEINLHKPWINLVNQDHVIMHNKSTVCKKYLDAAQLHGITELATTLADPETMRISSHLITTLQDIDPEILNNSYITCNHPQEIRIHMRNEHLELVCNRTHVPNKKIIDQCKRIKQELAEADGYPNGICADIRFNNQIIISKLQLRG